jgi:hypothetical protein
MLRRCKLLYVRPDNFTTMGHSLRTHRQRWYLLRHLPGHLPLMDFGHVQLYHGDARGVGSGYVDWTLGRAGVHEQVKEINYPSSTHWTEEGCQTGVSQGKPMTRAECWTERSYTSEICTYAS